MPPAARQKRRLGLLAVLALAGKQGMSRHRLEAYLWSESDSARARHALDQTIYALRRTLGGEIIVMTGQELTVNSSLLGADVWEFDAAVRASEWAAAVDLYKGDLLEGYYLGGSRELESWIDAERVRLLRQYQSAVGSLADRSASAGDHSQDIEWRRRLASSDPLSADSTKKLIRALAASGDRAGAVKQARQYQAFVRRELDMEPEVEIERLVSALSHASPGEESSEATWPAPPPVDAMAVEGPAPFEPEAESAEATALGERAHHAPPWTRWMRTASVGSIALATLMVLGALTLAREGPAGSLSGAAARDGARPSRVPLPAAREAYLRGLSAWEDRTQTGSDSAIVYFRRATELDPGYAAAYAGLAEAYVRIGYFGYRPAAAMFPKAKEAAQRSIRLDSTLASARTALATELIWEHEFAAAESEYRTAIALDPTNATTHQWYGVLLMILGRVRDAVAEEKRASELEPLSLQIQNNYATFLDVSGDREGALRQFRKTVDEEPDSAWVSRNPWLLANMSRVYAEKGEYAAAMRAIDRAIEIVPRIPRALYTLAVIHDEMGRPDLARQAFARADTSNEQYAAFRGMLYADQGMADSAFYWFARQQRWGIQPMLALQANLYLSPLRTDPRYAALLHRLGISKSR
ncbi:MAG: BTAD domain-containing putative transcriptional regulator [Gemmatimonadales bacterium]